VETLNRRRYLIRRLISIFRESMPNPFPNWRDSTSLPMSFHRDHDHSTAMNLNAMT
jgi:hypothetical protein